MESVPQAYSPGITFPSAFEELPDTYTIFITEEDVMDALRVPAEEQAKYAKML